MTDNQQQSDTALATQKWYRVHCGYEIRRGLYLFPDEQTAAEFCKDPTFEFSFDAWNNVDDKKGLLRIFGRNDPSPIYSGGTPTFELNDISAPFKNDGGLEGYIVVVSATVEMEFDTLVNFDEFKEWCTSDDSTWRYTGQIGPTGYDGILDSGREEYFFDEGTQFDFVNQVVDTINLANRR
jgi:hypothetical protein